MIEQATWRRPVVPARPGRSALSIVMACIDRVLRMAEVARQRRALASLDDRALLDIGIGRAEAFAESSRPFWDLRRGV